MKNKTSIIFLVACTFPLVINVHHALAIDLKANFRLFGEVNRFSFLGFGDMFISFDVNTTGSATSGSEIGRIEYPVGNSPVTTGVLSPLTLPNMGFQVVDFEFSVPFSLEEDKTASMFIGLGTNFVGSASSGSKQVIFDFSDNIFFGGSLLQNTFDQGLSLTSVTLADGTPLSQAGLEFEIIPENTVLGAAASAFDNLGSGLQTDVQPGTSDRAAVFPFSGTATAKLFGGSNSAGNPTQELVNLDVNPEPDPLVFDLAGASMGGTNNIKLTRVSQPIPEPTTILGLLAFGGVGLLTSKKKK